MSERGKYAVCTWWNSQSNSLQYDYVYFSTHDDIYNSLPSHGVMYNGERHINALAVEDKTEISFLSSYQNVQLI